MVPGSRLEGMRPACTAHAASRTRDDGRALVVRLIALHAGADVGLARRPCALERGAIALRIVAREKRRILRDARRDKIFRDLTDDRPALFFIRAQQCFAAPALKTCGELPAEIDRVLQSI